MQTAVRVCHSLLQLSPAQVPRAVTQAAYSCLDAACRACTEAAKQQPCLPISADGERGGEQQGTLTDSAGDGSTAAGLHQLQSRVASKVMELIVATLGLEASQPLQQHVWQDSLALLLRIAGGLCPPGRFEVTCMRAVRAQRLLPRASASAAKHAGMTQTVAALVVTMHLALQPSVNPPAIQSIASVCAQPLAALARRIAFADISSSQVAKPQRLPGLTGAAISFLYLDAQGWATATKTGQGEGRGCRGWNRRTRLG